MGTGPSVPGLSLLPWPHVPAPTLRQSLDNGVDTHLAEQMFRWSSAWPDAHTDPRALWFRVSLPEGGGLLVYIGFLSGNAQGFTAAARCPTPSPERISGQRPGWEPGHDLAY